MSIETISETRCFGGTMGFYEHTSSVNHCDMRFAVFTPPQAAAGSVPVVTFLSGLTCTDENFMVKAGAQRYAAELGLMIVAPDTSPRGDDVPDDPEGAVRATHQQLADMLGTWRETVSKTLQDFRRRGLVASGRRQLTLLDKDALYFEAGGIL